MISVYSEDKPYKIYCHECYFGDGWNPMDMGREVDFSRPFLEQFKGLQRDVPRQYAFVFQNVNSEYTNGSAYNKNCYLIFVSDHNEDSQYSYSIFNCRNVCDLLNSTECELCYECVTCRKCYRVSFSEDCAASQNLAFCRNCTNCHDCLGCVKLKNQEYSIFNQLYSKEEYERRIAEMRLDTREGQERANLEAREFWKNYPVKYIHGFQNTGVTGDYLFNSKNSFRCFDSDALEDCKFMNHGNKSKFVYDAYVCVDNSEYSLEIIGALAAQNTKFSAWPFTSFDCDYVDNCENSNNLFGCVGMRKKQYCILNRQYSKEEYGPLREKIIKQMNDVPYVDAKGRIYKYGEFFPAELCPFSYNEAVVQEYFPLTKEQAIAEGYRWKDPEDKGYDITLQPENIPDSIAGVGDEILAQVIGCEHEGTCTDGCTSAFRITPAELQFYRRVGIPIPKLCFACRHFARLGKKNPIELHHHTCQCAGAASSNGAYKNTGAHVHGTSPCPSEFETTYPPGSPAIVYCESCYQSEVA
jgi:hypothetical protein